MKKKWILREKGSGTRDIFINTLGEYSKQINIFMVLRDVEEIKQLLLKYKDTISAMSKVAIYKELEEKKLFAIEIKNFRFQRSFYLIYHKNKTHTLLFKTFCEFLKENFEKLHKSNP